MDKKIEIANIAKEIPELTKKDLESINEFLVHDEWGIALEIICSILLEENILVSKTVYNSVKKTGEEMDMDSSNWDEIRHLIKD